MAENQPNPDMPEAPPGYKIIKKMGQGGMAAVYLAIQESFGRQVALKIMSDELGKDSIWAKRFIKEAQIVAQLSHPNIVPVFDVGTFKGRFYISMELLKGGNLDDRIAKGLSIPEIVKIIVGVAAGLDFAGEKGFVHRDIKPDNVMFREDGSPVILDFGIVKQKGGSGDKMTQTGTIVGTTAYMSPEQAMGKELDEGSDIYSLGVMFYELLTGRVPFHGDSAVAVLLKHVNEPPPPLPEFVSVFQPVIDKAMAKKREDRYSRARAMIEHIQELEPQIREALARNQAMFAAKPAGANDKTNVQTAVGGKAVTSATNAATVITGAVQGDDNDLSAVLTSAKKTISNFSEESRVKRAKNLKRAIIAGVLIVVSALGYVAYQQLYVVPQAGELAAKERQEKIDSLMSIAEDMRDDLAVTDLKAVDALIAQYGEILVLDPENADVRDAMDKLGEEYLRLGNEALAANNLAEAESYAEYVSRLAPKNAELAALRDKLKEVRAASTQQELESEFKEQQIAALMNDAQVHIKAGRTFSPQDDCAYSKFQQILKIDPANADAQNQINTMINAVFSETQSQIAGGQLRNALSNIELLEKVATDKSKIPALKSAYASAKQKAEEQAKLAGAAQRKEELLSKINRLKRESRTRTSNNEMRDAAFSLLDMDAGNATAQPALQDANKFDAEQIDSAIKKRDYSRAGQHVADLEKHAPDYAGLGDLKNRYSAAKSAAAKADEMLASANQLIASPKPNDAKREDLSKAYGLITSAKQTDPANPAIASTLAALEMKYTQIIGILMTTQQRDLLALYFKDTDTMEWPSDQILQAQLAWKSAPVAAGGTAITPPVEKPKPRRTMSGGF